MSEDKDEPGATWSLGRTGTTPRGHSDIGTAARFFYCAKASRKEREAGLREAGLREAGSYEFRRDGSLDGKTTARAANHHPTVKPISLMRYLCRLVKMPEDTLILDPFAGSGSTGIAALAEGCRFVGIEKEHDYLKIAEARIAHAEDTAEMKLGV